MGLFDSIWKTGDPGKRDEAIADIEKISDPKKLRDVALSAPLSEVQCAAIARINDQAILREIVLSESSSFDARTVAVRRITSPEVLTEIAMLRACYPADGEAIAMLNDQQLLKRIAMAEEGWEQAKAVYRISDPHILAEVAMRAEKAAARKTAIRAIDDPDALLDIMEQAVERFIITEAFRCFDERLKALPPDSLTVEQHERYLNVILRETQKDAKVSLDSFQNDSDLTSIYQEASREDLRAEAFSRLIAGRIFSPQNLKEACKEAYRNYTQCQHTEGNLENPWDTVLGNLETRIINSHDPALLLDCIIDPEMGCDFAGLCLGTLFSDRFMDEAGIDTLRDESAAAFLTNISVYSQLAPAHDMDYCLRLAADAIPPKMRENKWYARFLRNKK